MMKKILILVFLFLSKISFANSIVADLSIDSININTGFNGAELFLFGTYDGQDGDDLFIFIEGPKTEATIYKKEYFYGIWINRENVTFKNIPSFYYSIFSSEKPNKQNLNYLKKYNLGNADLIISEIPKKSIKDMPQWKETFKNKMIKDSHWISKRGVKAENIEIKNNKLFRAPVVLPASVLPGEYKVKILHLRDGLKISEENTNIFVRKTGFEARIYSFAHNYSAFYGIFAIILAILAGYLAALSFRKI